MVAVELSKIEPMYAWRLVLSYPAMRFNSAYLRVILLANASLTNQSIAMGRELQKKKNRSSISKVKHKSKSKRLNVLGNAIVAANW